jgi:hypothetical protein
MEGEYKLDLKYFYFANYFVFKIVIDFYQNLLEETLYVYFSHFCQNPDNLVTDQ